MKVMTYNIHCGGDGRLPGIVQTIRAQQPDAVALQEVTSQSSVESIARDLGMHCAFGDANCEFAVAWLSRLPIRRWQNHRLPNLAKTLLEVEVAWNRSIVALFATHLVDGRTVKAARRRAAEARAILGVLEAARDQPHLLLGDFNALDPNDPIGEPPPGARVEHVARMPIRVILAAGYTDCYRKLHPTPPGYTYASGHPWLRLDYVFASPTMAAHLAATNVVSGALAEAASDHLPVWAEFR